MTWDMGHASPLEYCSELWLSLVDPFELDLERAVSAGIDLVSSKMFGEET